MSDGDVDSEQLTFNTISGRIVRRRHTSEDDTRDRSAAVWMTPAQLLARRKAIAAFGADIADPLDSSLLTSGFLTRDGRIVGMALGPSSSGNVWLLDSVARTRTALLPRPGFPWSASLLGGVEIGRELLLVTSVDRNAWFVRMSPAGKPEELGMVEAVCAYCGGVATEWDHLRPLVVNKQPTGYISEIHNLVPACGKCNQSKGNKNWREWLFSSVPRSPKSRGVPDLDSRVSRLDEFELSLIHI